MENGIPLVLIHGAGLNSSIWEDFQKEIAMPSLAIRFPHNSAENKVNTITFDDYVDAATNQILRWKKNGFIIVAHSIGACVGLKVAHHFKNELRGFAAIGSVVPLDGNSFVSSLPIPQRFIMPMLLRLFGTKPPQQSIERDLCNDLTPEQTQKIAAEFTPESKALFTTKINFPLPDTYRLYVKLTNDKTMPNAFQDRMAKHLAANRIIAIDSGHLPMMSKTKQLAAIFSDVVGDIVRNTR